MDRHALFAVVEGHFAFRVGQPTTWGNAQQRWSRADDRRVGANGHKRRACTVLGPFGASYPVMAFEVRAVDAKGGGLGSVRHALAVPVPYRALRTALRPR